MKKSEKELSQTEINRLIEAAKLGEQEEARAVIEQFCLAVDEERKPNKDCLQYFRHCFNNLLNNVDGHKAFHLKKEPEISTRDRDKEFAIQVGARIKSGLSRDAAIGQVAKEIRSDSDEAGKKHSQILQAYYNYRNDDDIYETIELIGRREDADRDWKFSVAAAELLLSGSTDHSKLENVVKEHYPKPKKRQIPFTVVKEIFKQIKSERRDLKKYGSKIAKRILVALNSTRS